jgi:hypothetical protein
LSFICLHNKHWLLLQSKLSWSISKIWSWLFTHLWLDKQDRRLKISLLWHLISSLKTLTVDSNILNKHFSLCCYPSWFQKVLEVACSAEVRSDFDASNTFLNIYFAHKNHWFLRVSEVACSAEVRSVLMQLSSLIF